MVIKGRQRSCTSGAVKKKKKGRREGKKRRRRKRGKLFIHAILFTGPGLVHYYFYLINDPDYQDSATVSTPFGEKI